MGVISNIKNPIGFYIDFVENGINEDFKKWKADLIASNPHGYDHTNETYYSHTLNPDSPTAEYIFKSFEELFSEEIEARLKKEYENTFNFIIEYRLDHISQPNRFQGYIEDKIIKPLQKLEKSYEELFKKIPVLQKYANSIRKRIVEYYPIIAQKLDISYLTEDNPLDFTSIFEETFEFLKTAQYRNKLILPKWSYDLLLKGFNQIYTTGKLSIESKVVFNGIKPNIIGNFIHIFNEELSDIGMRLEYENISKFLPSLIEGFTENNAKTFKTKSISKVSHIHSEYMIEKIKNKFLKYKMFKD